MHRIVTRTIAALGVAGAIALGLSAPASAQGIYLNGPGVSVGIGNPGWYGHRHYRHYGYYDRGYYDRGPYWGHRRAYRYYED